MRSKRLEEYKKTLTLSDEQREVLIGILLGDAALETQNRGRTYRLKIEHSIKQCAYLEHLYELFREWVNSPPRLKEVRLANGKTYTNMAFSTLSHEGFRFYAHQFYRDGKKAVPKLIEKWLTPIALAYWFMDDGSIKSKQSKGVILNTQGYQKHEVERLVEVLQKKYSMIAKTRAQKEGYQIYVSGESYERFKELIGAYVLPEMEYKIPEARRTHLPKA